MTRPAMTLAAAATHASVVENLDQLLGVGVRLLIDVTPNGGCVLVLLVRSRVVQVDVTNCGHAYLTHGGTTRPYSLRELIAVVGSPSC